DDRIGAREMLDLAVRTIAPPAALRKVSGGAAIRTEAVAGMPVQQRLGGGDRRQVVLRDEAADRDRAQVGDKKIAARFQGLRGCGIDADAEAAGAVERAEENGFG